MLIEMKVLHPDAEIPVPATPSSAGVDLRAMLESPMVIQPGSPAVLIPTGLAMHLDQGRLAALILPRSGLGHKKGLVLGNLVGLVDGDYQGELFISAWNRSGEPILIEHKERIAQMIIVPVYTAAFKKVDEFSAASDRGEGGFGSTGTT